MRFSGEWGLWATEHMVEIYLAPDSPDLWADDDGGEDRSSSKDTIEACKVADKLLRDIPSASRVRTGGVCQTRWWCV